MLLSHTPPSKTECGGISSAVDESVGYDDDKTVRRRVSSGRSRSLPYTTSTTGLLPTARTIRAAASTVKKEHRMWKLCHDAALSVLISVVLAVSLNSETLRSAYMFRKSLMDSFVRARYGTNLSFTEV